jgi:hypothetical protein
MFKFEDFSYDEQFLVTSMFTFRFNRRFYPFNAFRSLLGIAGDVNAPTFEELYSGKLKHPTCCR